MDQLPADLQSFDSPAAIGEYLAGRILPRIEVARLAGRSFLLGCPTGRSPRPVYTAMARLLGERGQDLSKLILVMMDEYLDGRDSHFQYVSDKLPWSCHRFARDDIRAVLNASLAAGHNIPLESIWFPDPGDPAAYDGRISGAGGIDFFILASGASDGHVAFNPPGSERDSRTRIIELSEQTRRDNLQSFPELGTLDRVPTHGISVGIDTIASARAAAMIVWGASKAESVRRMLATTSYGAAWPATVIHDCPGGVILADREAARGVSVESGRAK